MEERRDTLQKAVEILNAEYRVGTVDFKSSSLALNRVGDVRLELARNKADRIAACEKQVESAETSRRFVRCGSWQGL